MLVPVLLALGGALGGGALAYLTAPGVAVCDDTVPGVAAACAAEGAGATRLLLGAALGALVALAVAYGRRRPAR